MDKSFERALKKYYKEIRSFLIVRTKESQKFMAEFCSSVEDYIEANKIQTVDAVKEHFGTPEEIAKAFLETAQLGYIRKRVRIKNTILIIMLAAFLSWFTYLTIAFIGTLPNGGGYGVETIMDPAETTTDENFVIGDTA